jgi:hypothetical protein
VDRGNAIRASDQGWGVVVEANDGEPKSRRRSGERWWPEQKKLSENVCVQCKNKCARGSRMCSGSRTRRG